MSSSNPETGGPSPEEVSSEESEEKISHGEQSRREAEERWEKSTAGELLASLEKQQEEGYAIAEALGMQLEATVPLSREKRSEIRQGLKEIDKKASERHQAIMKLMKMKSLREMAAFHLSSIGDWMETISRIGKVDFNYDRSQPLLGQIEQLEGSLSPEIFRFLEAKAGECWQDFEKACKEHNEIRDEIARQGDIAFAEKLEKLGVFDTKTRH